MSKKSAIRAIVIDDHLMFLQSVVRVLEEDPQIVVVGTALTAAKGVEKAQQLRPDIVITDYHLPDMDAPAAIKMLRDVHPAGKIITVTGSEEAGALTGFKESSNAGVLERD